MRCAVCGTETDFVGLASTSAFGRMDLDARPPIPARFALKFRLHQCSRCGYAAADVGEAPERAREVVESAEYRALMEDASRGPLQRRYACAAYVAERTAEPGKAGHLHKSAAWVADDDRDTAHAVEHRLKAIECFGRAREAKESFAEKPIFEDFMLIDLERRAGRFDQAGRRVLIALPRAEDPFHVAILKLQAGLIERKDVDRHEVPRMSEEDGDEEDPTSAE